MYHVQVTTSTIYVYTLDVQTLLYTLGTRTTPSTLLFYVHLFFYYSDL